MMKPEDVKVGMRVRCGIERPREAEVVGSPKSEGGSVRVTVKFKTGELYDAPLWMLSLIIKRPSARRVSVKDVAREFEAGGGTIGERELDLMRKAGVK